MQSLSEVEKNKTLGAAKKVEVIERKRLAILIAICNRCNLHLSGPPA
jgi:hypothetical protein